MNMDSPTQTQFQNAQAVIQQTLKQYSENLDTKKASVINELIVRPLAYLYAQINKYITNRLSQSSIKTLLTSQKTQNQVADLVASNYMVQRLPGKYASGIVTAQSTTASICVAKDTVFVLGGISFMTDKTIIALPQVKADTDNIHYIRSIKYGQKYLSHIPVKASQVGSIQIPQSTTVTSTSYIAGVQEFFLTSPITGGSDVQTDAQMIQRCLKKCGASVGTQNAIWSRLQQSPITVLSCKAVGSSDIGCLRSRYNNLDIPIAGIVDIYVKTQNQASVYNLKLQSSDSNIHVSASQYPDLSGAIRVQNVIQQGDSGTRKYSVKYGSNDFSVGQESARLSKYQDIVINIDKFNKEAVTDVQISYMPGIAQIQTYMQQQDTAFLGQSFLVKAAVPVTLCLTCSVQAQQPITDTTLESMRSCIANLINSYQVGVYKLNMDDIAVSFRNKFPTSRLKLPYSIQALIPMLNGGIYTFNSNTGVIDINFRQKLYFWNNACYFFSTTADQVTLNIL